MNAKAMSILVATLLLVAIATAYALWADVLKVKVQVQTGEIDINFTGTPYPSEIPEEYEGKDVGSCVARYENVQNEEDFANFAGLLPNNWNSGSANDDYELLIEINNAYPGYVCKIDNMDVKNIGTVPVKILVKLVNETGHVLRPVWVGSSSYIDVDGDGCFDIDVDYSSFFSLNRTQIHPGDSRTFSVVVRIPTEHQRCVKENHTYKFYVVIIGYQWNEFPG